MSSEEKVASGRFLSLGYQKWILLLDIESASICRKSVQEGILHEQLQWR